MVIPKSNPDELKRRARYLQSIAALVKDAAKHDELQLKALDLLEKARQVKGNVATRTQQGH
jgi:hypothetical protein